MTICERMFDLLESTPGKNASGLCRKLGVKTNKTSNWKQRNTDPPAKFIIPICEYLGVSVVYLLTGDLEPVVESVDLDEREQNLIEHFRALDLDGKATVESAAVNEHKRVKLEGDSEETAI